MQQVKHYFWECWNLFKTLSEWHKLLAHVWPVNHQLIIALTKDCSKYHCAYEGTYLKCFSSF